MCGAYAMLLDRWVTDDNMLLHLARRYFKWEHTHVEIAKAMCSIAARRAVYPCYFDKHMRTQTGKIL